MDTTVSKLIVITGGPGAGKTSTLEQLQQAGYSVVREVARKIIAERKSQGLSPRPEPAQFAQAIFEQDVQQYDLAAARNELTFFDRSILDSLGGLMGLGLMTETQRNEVVARYPYHSSAFIFPPWKAIYRTDSERDQTYDESVRVYNSICRFYKRCGYTLLEVPRLSVDERCQFLIDSTAGL